MKFKKLITLILGVVCSATLLSGCSLAKSFEEELNVVFMAEGDHISDGTVTQFKNIKTPTISDAYLPDADYRFVGWTCYQENQLDLTSPANFKKQYIRGGAMLHYMDVEKFKNNNTVVCNALIMHKDDIPKDYHYAVVAWYDKVATSGIDQNKATTLEEMVKTYLTSEGVSQEDQNTIVFRGYTGNVGASTGAIMNDDDVDIMIGWATNISTTGVIPETAVLEDVTFNVPGVSTPTRHIHRLTNSNGCLKVMEYLKSDEVKNFFDPQ
ncbi:MAG: hypothetical protein SO206_02830 [Bacilli bacterium]|nr:hypothetical protein [Bacilli bacterium]